MADQIGRKENHESEEQKPGAPCGRKGNAPEPQEACRDDYRRHEKEYVITQGSSFSNREFVLLLSESPVLPIVAFLLINKSKFHYCPSGVYPTLELPFAGHGSHLPDLNRGISTSCGAIGKHQGEKVLRQFSGQRVEASSNSLNQSDQEKQNYSPHHGGDNGPDQSESKHAEPSEGVAADHGSQDTDDVPEQAKAPAGSNDACQPIGDQAHKEEYQNSQPCLSRGYLKSATAFS
jgi:hypothetical protein